MKKLVKAGNVSIGGGFNISIQSMTNTDTRDIEATVAQILELEQAGADIVRVSVYDEKCACALPHIIKRVNVPLIADIHFDYRLAVLAIENGIHKLRINPGNIGSPERVRIVADAARAHGVPIRVGVNSGSLEKELLRKYGGVTPEALVESAMKHVKMLEDANFYDIVISIKASGVLSTIRSYRIADRQTDYPLHVGVTEPGFGDIALVKSAVGIGSLLADGIGDTVRVSMTGNPVKEVEAAQLILASIGKLPGYIDIVSCPTCGRTSGDIEGVVKRLTNALGRRATKHIKIAVMGCAVNGPGEAREADIGIAFARGGAAVFMNGETVYNGDIEPTVEHFIEDCKKLCK